LPNSKIIRTAPEAQGESGWNPPTGTLGRLVDEAWERSRHIPTLDRSDGLSRSRGVASLGAVLHGPHVGVIAEIKRSSPSRGTINSGIDGGRQASLYERGGAAAISVLTEPVHFGGSNEDLEIVRKATRLPVLRKDFHVSEAQIGEAAWLGASAALVIVRSVDPSRLADLASTARDLSLELVFEVRDERELERALGVGAMIIGVNNRDLESLRIDPGTVGRIVPMIPPDRVAIAESGYSTRADVIQAALSGADAVLVGSSLSASADPEAAVRLLADVPRTARKS
jgi:indole-3-glycerol phosphate synthase